MKSRSKINNKNGAIQHLNEILTIWPMVEGEVSTRDSKLYSDIETKIPTAIGLLDSKQVKKRGSTGDHYRFKQTTFAIITWDKLSHLGCFLDSFKRRVGSSPYCRDVIVFFKKSESKRINKNGFGSE